MPDNGAGTFSRIYSWVTQAGLGTKIRSDLMDTDSNDIASGLSNRICKDGQTTITANIPFNAKKITGLGAGTLATDAAQLQQVQSGQVNWVAAGGTADALTATLTPAIASLTDGLICYVRAASANATTTPTFAPNGLTAHTITKNGGQALVAGDIYGAGHEIELRYNLANTRWELANPSVTATTVSDATISTTDITTNNVSSAKHGFTPKSPANAAQFLNGAATPAYAAVTDANLSVSDVTTNNVSTSAHGFAPKAPNDATKYLDGTGAYSVPNGKLVLLATATASSSSTLNFTSNISASYYQYIVVFADLLTSTSSSIGLKLSSNNGSTYAATLSSQKAVITLGGTTAPTYTGTSSPALITTSQASDTFSGYAFMTVGATAGDFLWESTISNGAGSIGLDHTYVVLTATSAINAFQLIPSAGNFTSGNVYLYGVKNT